MSGETFGARVKAARLAKGWSQRKLEREGKLSKGYVSRIESDARGERPGPELVADIARALGVDRDELAHGTDAETAPARSVEKAPRYQNIEAAIAYHPSRWSPETLAAGRGIARDGDEDRPPKEWEELLDRLEAAISGKGTIGTPVEDDEAPPPRAKRRRP